VDILGGSLDPADYRQPIMTLLLIKRLNDTFEENAEKLVQQGKSQDPRNGTGFPMSLFKSNPDSYPQGSGGESKDKFAKIWWTDCWDRSVEETNGNNGWTLQLQF